MSKLSEAKKKLTFADYLLSRNDNNLNQAALKNVFDAANLSAAEFMGADSVTPAMLRNRFEEGSEAEQEFSGNFLELWKMTSESPSRENITKAYNRVKAFVKFVEEKIVDSTLDEL